MRRDEMRHLMADPFQPDLASIDPCLRAASRVARDGGDRMHCSMGGMAGLSRAGSSFNPSACA
jgi:hypothetical protein